MAICCNLCFCLEYCKVVIAYYWMIFISLVSDTKGRIWKLKPIPDVERKDFTVVVTGGGRGLGAFIVKKLLNCGMTVIVGIRNPDRCKELITESEKLSGKMVLMELDVSNMISVKRFAKEVNEKYNTINILVNNAGVIQRNVEVTDEGFDPILATNYLGHFLLTHLLIKNLQRAAIDSGNKSRIVHVSSCAHAAGTIDLNDINMKERFIRLACYGRSKLAQLMSSRYLDYKLKDLDYPVMSIAVHPGVVGSNMSDDWKRTCLPVSKTLLSEEKGARNALFACLDSSFKGGEYFYNDSEGRSTAESKNKTKQQELFEFTCRLLEIKSFFD